VDDQTTMNEKSGKPESASRRFARGVGDFTHDVLTLTELQAQLLAADLQECRQRVLIPTVLLLSGVAVSLACFPIALTALAMFLIQSLQISSATGFLLAFIVGAVLGILMTVVGWYQVGRRMAVLQRSKQELVRNLRWIKKVLHHSRTR
jgi:cytochrome bd-type quinol oxidase subunit 1